MRLLVASALALLGLTGVVGVTLHQVFEYQARENLRERAKLLALGAGAFASSIDAPQDAVLQQWLEADEDFAAARFIDGNGHVVRALSRSAHPERHPPLAPPRTHQPSREATVVERKSDVVAFVSLPERTDGVVGVEVVATTIRLAHELQNLRWLFGSIFLLAGAVFAALALYLTRGVVLPLEEVRRAALRMVNGEMNVRIPVSGDREIDDIARFFHSLAERRNGGPAQATPPTMTISRALPSQPPV